MPVVPHRLSITPEQAEAIHRIAQERGVTKGHFLRELIAAATGVPNTIKQRKPHPYYNIAAVNAKRAERAAARKREAGPEPPAANLVDERR